MSVAERIHALMGALTIDDVEALPPAQRRKLAAEMRYWAGIADPQKRAQTKLGIISELNRYGRHPE